MRLPGLPADVKTVASLADRPYSLAVTGVRTTPSLRELVEARRDEIKAIVARHHGRSIALFGSAARGDDHAGSDLDFLVEFEPGARPFELLLLGAELEATIGVPVDVGTRETLRKGLRDDVLAEAVPL